MIESTGTEAHGHAVWFSEEHTPVQYFLIVGHSNKGLELPHIFSASGVFAFHTSVKGVLLDPQPGLLSVDVMVSLVGLNAFMSSVLETRSYSPATGARS